jgi:hypothetical protein
MTKPTPRPTPAARILRTTELADVTGGDAAPPTTILKPKSKTASDDWLAPVV